MSAQPLPHDGAAAVARLQDLDREHASLALASVNEAGAPHVAHTFFAWDFASQEPALVVSVLSHSAKMANIRRDGRVGFTIGGNLPDLWLNGHGEATELDGADAARALALLKAKNKAVEAFVSRLPTAYVRIAVSDYRITDVREPGSPPLVFAYPA